MLGIGGGYTLARQYVDDGDSGGLLAGGATVTETTLGDWPVQIVADWDAASVEREPTLVLHETGGISIFSDAQTHETTVRLDNSTMQLITTSDPADVSIDNFPALLIEDPADGSTGSITLFEEGDV